jgi:hypothetical protein
MLVIWYVWMVLTFIMCTAASGSFTVGFIALLCTGLASVIAVADTTLREQKKRLGRK